MICEIWYFISSLKILDTSDAVQAEKANWLWRTKVSYVQTIQTNHFKSLKDMMIINNVANSNSLLNTQKVLPQTSQEFIGL